MLFFPPPELSPLCLSQVVCLSPSLECSLGKLKLVRLGLNVKRTTAELLKDLSSEDALVNLTCCETAVSGFTMEELMDQACHAHFTEWRKQHAESALEVALTKASEAKDRIVAQATERLRKSTEQLQWLGVMQKSWRDGVPNNSSLTVLSAKAKGSIAMRDVVLKLKSSTESVSQDLMLV